MKNMFEPLAEKQKKVRYELLRGGHRPLDIIQTSPNSALWFRSKLLFARGLEVLQLRFHDCTFTALFHFHIALVKSARTVLFAFKLFFVCS